MQTNLRRPKPPRGWHPENSYKRPDGTRHGLTESVWVRDGHHLEACTGDAHSDPHIDHCARCAPLWGIVAVANDLAPEQVTIRKPVTAREAAKLAGCEYDPDDDIIGRL